MLEKYHGSQTCDKCQPRPKCPECGSANVKHDCEEPEVWDCLTCGIWFDPQHPLNREACWVAEAPDDQGL